MKNKNVIFKIFHAILIFSSFFTQGFANFAYVTNFGTGVVSVIDTSTNMVVATIGGFTSPVGVAITPNGAFAYVVDENAQTVSVIDTSTNTLLPSPIVVGFGAYGIAITPNGDFAYVTNNGDETVSVIDTSTNLVVGSPILVGSEPLDIAVTPNGSFVYVSNQGDGTVSVIQTSNNTVVGLPISVGSGVNSGPGPLAITPNGQFVYVVNQNDGTISVIQTSNNTVIGSPIMITGNAVSLGISPDGKFVYATNFDFTATTVSVIDTSTNMVVGPGISLGSGNVDSQGLAFTPNGKFLYVTNFGIMGTGNTVSVIDTGTNMVTDTITILNASPDTAPFMIAITPDPPSSNPPTPENLTGRQAKNDAGLVFELSNKIKWSASVPATDVVGYYVYRNGSRIATLSATTFEYVDHNRKKGTTVYAVTAFNAAGLESAPISISIK